MSESNIKKQYSILIVDDEPANIQLMGNLLRENDYHVEFTTNGKQALEWVESEQFDLILLDVMMPGMDGFEVCQVLKSLPTTRDIPIIFLTAKTQPEDIVKGFELGGADYVSKPFNQKELLQRIHTHLEIKLNREILVKKNETQNELLHVLSHDLSNSIGAILSILEIVQEKPENLNEFLQLIDISANNALNMVDFSRTLLAAEEKPMAIGPLNLKQLIRQSEIFVRQKLNDKEITLEVNIPDEIDIIAEETTVINSVFINLITNAIKFSERGSTISISSTEKDEDKITFCIRDNGFGIPSDLINDLFDFTKATNRAGTEDESGTGFGMPLVKKFMKKYGGDVSISSRPIEEHPTDPGTEITLTFNTG
jgi:two-component system, sensor histidine kinase and response regulator